MQQTKKKIVLISSGQPSANPRLVKEALALVRDYSVTVIYCPLSPWADAYDKELFQQHPQIDWVRVGYHPIEEKRKYFLVRLRQKIYQKLSSVLPANATVAIRSMVFYSQELTVAAKLLPADIYIGHNLGAFPAVITAAKANNAKAAFDFEDYHRGEDIEQSAHWIKTQLIEDAFVTSLDYATAASPLIAATYKKHYPQLKITTLNNCFPLTYRTSFHDTEQPPLKLFWFSQFVGPNRGLETIVEAIGLTKNKNIQLSMLGNVSQQNREYFQTLATTNGLLPEQIKFLNPVREDELVKIAADHHLGMASEVQHVPNRDLCLTNKIFIYLLAGNAIVFSETKAQKLFLDEHKNIGSVYKQGDTQELKNIINSYLNNWDLLRQHRSESFRTGAELLNWEKESQKLLLLLKQELV